MDADNQIFALCFELPGHSSLLDHLHKVWFLCLSIERNRHLVERICYFLHLIFQFATTFCIGRYTAFIVLYPIGVFPGESKTLHYLRFVYFHMLASLVLYRFTILNILIMKLNGFPHVLQCGSCTKHFHL